MYEELKAIKEAEFNEDQLSEIEAIVGEGQLASALSDLDVYSRPDAFEHIVSNYVDNDPYDESYAMEFAQTIKEFEATPGDYLFFDAYDNVDVQEIDESLIDELLDNLIENY